MINDIYGIGNPLIDIFADVSDSDLSNLGLNKGTMHLIDLEERKKILDYISNKELCYACGGSCPNTMIALSSFGVKSALGGKIGLDDQGEQYKNQLKTYNTTSCIKQANGVTGSSIILISPDTERTMNTYLGINREFSRDDIDYKVLEKSDFLYFTGYMWDTDLQKEAILECIDFANKNDKKIIFDAADPFAVNRNIEDFIKLIKKHIYIVFANNEEAKILTSLEDPIESSKYLSSISQIAVVKNGSEGSIVQEGTNVEIIPINKVKAIDSTGAGDMYAAGFIYGVINKFNLRDSGICASYLASQIVQTSGAQFTPEQFKLISEALSNGSWKYCS